MCVCVRVRARACVILYHYPLSEFCHWMHSTYSQCPPPRSYPHPHPSVSIMHSLCLDSHINWNRSFQCASMICRHACERWPTLLETICSMYLRENLNQRRSCGLIKTPQNRLNQRSNVSTKFSVLLCTCDWICLFHCPSLNVSFHLCDIFSCNVACT